MRLLHDLELVENVGFETLVGREAGSGHVLLHARVVFGGLALLVSADCANAQIAEARVEVGFGLFGTLAVGLWDVTLVSWLLL